MKTEKTTVEQNELFIEIGGKKMPTIAGKIKFFNRDRDFGFIEVQGLKDVGFRAENLRAVYAGIRFPEIGNNNESRFQGPDVLFLEPEKSRQGIYWTLAVVSRKEYDAVAKNIAALPVYLAYHVNPRFKGQFMKAGAKNQPYFRGTLKQLEAEFPRLAPNDPLAAGGYVTDPISTDGTVWKKLTPAGEEIPIDDPRRMPEAVTKVLCRIFEAVENEPVQCFYGNLGQLLETTGYRGEKFSLEIAQAGANPLVWTEIADPRQPKIKVPVASTAEPMTSGTQPDRKLAEKPAMTSVPTIPAKKSVAPAPQIQKRPLTTEISLDDLGKVFDRKS